MARRQLGGGLLSLGASQGRSQVVAWDRWACEWVVHRWGRALSSSTSAGDADLVGGSWGSSSTLESGRCLLMDARRPVFFF
ncbi:hypothetical protein TIFTF001_024854 [Ficus carica]|uniref:Uncharacterized protein n=1 Tax=Ficus carica TaxID=3494 RepID=A0AA88AYB3_FICCA|nr:hypothetical protein TIFTF001_024854 [Ficus carica]